MKILISDKLGQAGLDLLAATANVSYDMKTGLSKDELIAIIPEYDGLIIRSDTRPDADVITAGAKLKAIGRAGIGVDNIDLAAAKTHGIKVVNTPRANSIATAEQTLTLMLSINRFTAHSHASVGAGNWNRGDYVGTEIYGKTLGVIGFGYIGRLVTARAQAFGMKVVAADPYVSADAASDLGVELLPLDELLSRADLITLHAIVTDETKEMINADAIAKMKDGVMLVNVARGKLIDENALADALKSGKVAAAGLDVFYSEPPTDSPLIGLSNVTHTPHLGASSKEAQAAVGIQIVEQVLKVLNGETPDYWVNK
ncbi:MAG: D-3-phosphoglycerate dehydrogenase [Cellvibrionaceae bacterium]|jgi:D-3-phosphoglycerate dehydrogenase